MPHVICLGCNGAFKSIQHHLSKRPDCKRAYGLKRPRTEDALDGGSANAISEWSEVYRLNTRALVSDDLAMLRFEKMVAPGTVDTMKKLFTSWTAVATESIIQELEALEASSAVTKAADIVRDRLNFFDGIETQKKEDACLRKNLGSCYVSPVKRILGHHCEVVKNVEGQIQSSKRIYDVVWDIPLNEQLIALMRNDPVALDHILSSSERWSELREVNPPIPLPAVLCPAVLSCVHARIYSH